MLLCVHRYKPKLVKCSSFFFFFFSGDFWKYIGARAKVKIVPFFLFLYKNLFLVKES